MAAADPPPLRKYCLDVAQRATVAAAQLASTQGTIKSDWLTRSATLVRQGERDLLAANALDVAAAPDHGLTAAAVDRLRLNPQRVAGIAQDLEQVAELPDPIGQVIESTVRPNGLEIHKVRVPLGVVFFIYESRPNVTADAAAICVKSGNAVILRGGKEARYSSQAIVDRLNQAGREIGLSADAVQLVGTTNREAVGIFLGLDDQIDVVIPRGGEGLIRRVVADAHMPVIKHFAGNCHVYIDRISQLDRAEKITLNAKCQRMGVCNAAESLLVHADVASTFLPRICKSLQKQGVEIRGDELTCALIEGANPATTEDFAAEYLGPIISVKVVNSLQEAIRHINTYGSGHTDAIVTEHLTTARQFAAEVDSSAVMINASTRFNDGGQFGLGSEIGISTDKIHARGPCGIKELTSYKYVVYGNGQVRK